MKVLVFNVFKTFCFDQNVSKLISVMYQIRAWYRENGPLKYSRDVTLIWYCRVLCKEGLFGLKVSFFNKEPRFLESSNDTLESEAEVFSSDLKEIWLSQGDKVMDGALPLWAEFFELSIMTEFSELRSFEVTKRRRETIDFYVPKMYFYHSINDYNLRCKILSINNALQWDFRFFYKSCTINPLMAAPTAKPSTKNETKKEAARPWSTPFCSILGPYIIAMLPMYPLEIEKTDINIK